MKKLEIFDPAMCCATGVCGPGVDPELSRIMKDLEWLKTEAVEVIRHNLGQDPQAFVDNAEIAKLLAAQGADVLPITIVDGSVVKTNGYPTTVELESWIGNSVETKESVKTNGCCGGSSSGCCC